MPVGTVYVPTGPKVAGKCNLTALKNPEKWLVVVEKTWEHFKNHSKVAYNIMCLRYKQGMVDICDIAKFMRISRQRVYFVLNDIHNFAFKYAKEYGAYKPKPKMLKEGRVIVAKKENAEETTE